MPKRRKVISSKEEMTPDENPDEIQMFSDSSSDDSEADSLKMEYPNYLSDQEQEEVLPIDIDEEDDDDDSENNDYDETNNVEAWGKKKSNFFSADFVDMDWGQSYREKDQEDAEAEETDALEIQRRFLDNVHSSAFDTKTFATSEPGVENSSFATIDWNAIKKTDKVQVLNKQSPEFLSMMKKFRQRLVELKHLKPKPLKEFEIENGNKQKNTKLLHLKSQLLTHYVMNLSFYMALKSTNNHNLENPVLKKIRILETLLNEMEKVEAREELRTKFGNSKAKKTKAVTFAADVNKNGDATSQGDDDNNVNADEEATTEDKRLVTYQIVKNKGLLPHRKKEYRNPRVRNRMKFKRAVIKRKGQVRTPKTEMQRYGGEASGINPHVTKSIKFK